MKLLVLCLALTFSWHINGLSIGLGDLTKGAVDVGTGVITKIPDVVPSPTDFFQSTKNLVAGYPFDVTFKLINTFCSAALSEKTVKPRNTPNMNNLSLILKFDGSDYKTPLLKTESLWSHEKFNKDLPLVILITGWNTNYNVSENNALDTIYEAYRCRGGYNFVALDSAQYVDTLYSWSALNTEAIGEILAQGLEKLIESYPIEKIHLIGHSLGAHIAGSTGRNLNYKTQKLIPRITGLDPANPCFNEGEMLTGLARGDAEFVDIIHSNSGVLGKRDSMGDIDFYPNGLHPLPPGCLTITCAHARAWEFYAESAYPGYEENFLGIKCRSLTHLNSNSCPGKQYPMGYAVTRNVKGNFFLKTGSSSPYGLNIKGEKPTCAR